MSYHNQQQSSLPRPSGPSGPSGGGYTPPSGGGSGSSGGGMIGAAQNASTASGSVNTPNQKIDTTVRVFDAFYRFDVAVPAAEFDIVNSYFQSIFKTKDAALNFTTTLFRVSQSTNIPPLTLLNQIQDTDVIKVSAAFAYYLNGLRSPTTLLGVNTTLAPNLYTARNILS